MPKTAGMLSSSMRGQGLFVKSFVSCVKCLFHHLFPPDLHSLATSNHLKYIKLGLFCTLLIAGFTIQSETKLGAERQESLSAPGITVPFFQVVSGLPPASDFLHRFAKPPGHSFGYVPVESVDLRSLTKPARTEAAWIYLHNSDLPTIICRIPSICPQWQSSICR